MGGGGHVKQKTKVAEELGDLNAARIAGAGSKDESDNERIRSSTRF